jgi:hypothetical protein
VSPGDFSLHQAGNQRSETPDLAGCMAQLVTTSQECAIFLKKCRPFGFEIDA